MFTTIRQYRCDPAAMTRIAHSVDEHFADEIAGQPGFVAYECLDCGGGELITVTVFSDRDSAERSTELAVQFIHEQLADVELNRTGVSTGHVVVNRAKNDVLEMVHA